MNVVALSGGVGGARLVEGLCRALDGKLTVIVNTGDDCRHWGLAICPDLDTVMYTLAGVGDAARGWGLRGDTFTAHEAMRAFGEPAWFSLGDRDLATHLTRTAALARGEPLHAVTARLSAALGVTARVLPMSNEPAPTLVDTTEHGLLPFQEWLVLRRAPEVRGVVLPSGVAALPAARQAIDAADLVVIGPSNPYVSIEPILALPGVRDALSRRPVVAVSPIVGGAAVKGPLAEMIPRLSGVAPSAQAILDRYDGLVSAFVVERGDEIRGVPSLATDAVMRAPEDRLRLAREVLDLGARVRR